METISYSNKIAPRYYICADCLRKVDGTSVHALGAFFQVACSICGHVGLNTRIPEASFNKARKASRKKGNTLLGVPIVETDLSKGDNARLVVSEHGAMLLEDEQ